MGIGRVWRRAYCRNRRFCQVCGIQCKPNIFEIFRLVQLGKTGSWIAEDGGYAGGLAIDKDEGIAVYLVIALPSDGEAGIGFLEEKIFRNAIPRHTRGEVIRCGGSSRG